MSFSLVTRARTPKGLSTPASPLILGSGGQAPKSAETMKTGLSGAPLQTLVGRKANWFERSRGLAFKRLVVGSSSVEWHFVHDREPSRGRARKPAAWWPTSDNPPRPVPVVEPRLS